MSRDYLITAPSPLTVDVSCYAASCPSSVKLHALSLSLSHLIVIVVGAYGLRNGADIVVGVGAAVFEGTLLLAALPGDQYGLHCCLLLN